jgi:hypothetical protein
MRLRWLVAVSACVLAAITLAGCGGSSKPCLILSDGNKLCGQDAIAWCSANIPLGDTSDPNYPACLAVNNAMDKGQKVINVSPGPNGTLNQQTTTAP